MVYSKPMAMIAPSGGSPERGTQISIRSVDNERELQKLHRQIFLEALSFVRKISSDNPFEFVFVEIKGSNVVRRAVEELAGTMLLPDRQIRFQSPQEKDERGKREAEIKEFINRYSHDRNFSHGFRLMKEFVMGLKPYLDGLGAQQRVGNGSIDNLITIGFTEVPVKEVIQRRANDSRGYSLIQLVSENLKNEYKPGISADDKTRVGVKFFTELFKQALVEPIHIGEDYPVLKRLAKLYPGGRPARAGDELMKADKLISSLNMLEKERPAA